VREQLLAAVSVAPFLLFLLLVSYLTEQLDVKSLFQFWGQCGLKSVPL